MNANNEKRSSSQMMIYFKNQQSRFCHVSKTLFQAKLKTIAVFDLTKNLAATLTSGGTLTRLYRHQGYKEGDDSGS
ncbi:hypothetical protein RB195_023467 [Necator americanus]|uniref:Uncharacterized protein n=1 Tax=Necator americanus TaxID=51031 RepID=A0ABR1ELM2_NECAM